MAAYDSRLTHDGLKTQGICFLKDAHRAISPSCCISILIPVLFLLSFERILVQPPTQRLVSKLLYLYVTHLSVHCLISNVLRNIHCLFILLDIIPTSPRASSLSLGRSRLEQVYLSSSWRPTLLAIFIHNSSRRPSTRRQRLTTTSPHGTICPIDQLPPPCIPASARLTLPSHLPTQGYLMMMSFLSWKPSLATQDIAPPVSGPMKHSSVAVPFAREAIKEALTLPNISTTSKVEPFPSSTAMPVNTFSSRSHPAVKQCVASWKQWTTAYTFAEGRRSHPSRTRTDTTHLPAAPILRSMITVENPTTSTNRAWKPLLSLLHVPHLGTGSYAATTPTTPTERPFSSVTCEKGRSGTGITSPRTISQTRRSTRRQCHPKTLTGYETSLSIYDLAQRPKSMMTMTSACLAKLFFGGHY